MRKNRTFLFGELNPFMDVRPTKTPKPQSQPDWPPDAPADSGGREGWKEGGRGSISPPRSGRKALPPPEIVHCSSAKCASTSQRAGAPRRRPDGTARRAAEGWTVPGSGAEGRSAGDERGQRFLSAEAAWLLFPLRVPRGLHPTHQVHGHLRDHSTPPSPPGEAAKGGRRLGTAPRLWHRPCGAQRPSGWASRHPPTPPPSPPPRRGICGPGAAHTTCGAPLPPGAALLNVWQRAPSNVFSPPLASWKTFCPLEHFAKGKKIKKKKAENGEKWERRASTPQLSLSSPLRGEGRYPSLHFSHNLVNLSRVTTL